MAETLGDRAGNTYSQLRTTAGSCIPIADAFAWQPRAIDSIRVSRDMPFMLKIDLTGKHALVAGVADDGGFGFAIAKALAEAGAKVSVATWPPALGIFRTMLERGKLDASL